MINSLFNSFSCSHLPKLTLTLTLIIKQFDSSLTVFASLLISNVSILSSGDQKKKRFNRKTRREKKRQFSIFHFPRWMNWLTCELCSVFWDLRMVMMMWLEERKKVGKANRQLSLTFVIIHYYIFSRTVNFFGFLRQQLKLPVSYSFPSKLLFFYFLAFFSFCFCFAW